jgi:hypothetical protein
LYLALCSGSPSLHAVLLDCQAQICLKTSPVYTSLRCPSLSLTYSSLFLSSTTAVCFPALSSQKPKAVCTLIIFKLVELEIPVCVVKGVQLSFISQLTHHKPLQAQHMVMDMFALGLSASAMYLAKNMKVCVYLCMLACTCCDVPYIRLHLHLTPNSYLYCRISVKTATSYSHLLPYILIPNSFSLCTHSSPFVPYFFPLCTDSQLLLPLY